MPSKQHPQLRVAAVQAAPVFLDLDKTIVLITNSDVDATGETPSGDGPPRLVGFAMPKLFQSEREFLLGENRRGEPLRDLRREVGLQFEHIAKVTDVSGNVVRDIFA